MTREQIEKAAIISCASKDEVLTDFGRAALSKVLSGASTPCGTMQTKNRLRISLYYLNAEKHTGMGIL